MDRCPDCYRPLPPGAAPASARGCPHCSGPPPAGISGGARRGLLLGGLALIAAMLFKGKGLVLFALSKAKLLAGLFKLKHLAIVVKSGGSMLLMIWVYAMAWPVAFAVGFAVLLLVHELGHALALRALGIRFSAPIFIPFVGALIGLKEMPPDAGKEALVAFAGPFAGTIAAQVCLVAHSHYHAPVLLGLAQVGYLLNLINLAPYSPLDGGRIVAAISPRIWLLALPAMLLLGLHFHSLILLLVTALGVPRAIGAWRRARDPEQQQYFAVPARTRLQAAAGYLALAAFLAYMMHHAAQLHAAVGLGRGA